MPTSDVFLVFQWWGTLFLVGAAAYPLTRRLFPGWFDRGYFFTKAVGMALITYFVYLGGILHIVPFTQGTVWGAMGAVFVLGVLINRGDKWDKGDKRFILEELFFFVALLLWTWVKAHEPSIHGLEKFMDFGFTKSILNSQFFPAPDMWYAGFPINYYYFGHTVMAVLTKLSGINLTITFNLMLVTIFALTATMSFSIGKQLLRGIGVIGEIGGGILTAFLVTLAGNMQTLYAFTRGYTGDNVQPFWELAWKMSEIGGIRGIWDGTLWGKLGEGMNTYWYANATRFIPYTIHEFPSYSFVVSDVHGHVLSIPFVLLAIGLLITMFGAGQWYKNFQFSISNFQLIFYGFLCGVLLATNALDGLIYLGLLIGALGIFNLQFSIFNWKKFVQRSGLVIGAAVLTSVPFFLHFKSFVNGIAVNCPLSFLADTKVGLLIFEGVEKCQHSPLWMMWLLWGFFVYCGTWLIARIFNFQFSIFNQTKKFLLNKIKPHELLLIIFFVFSLVLIIFPEFFYFKDIYPMHFRSNTMFKLGYQAFILFSIVSGYTIVSFSLRVFNRVPSTEYRGKTWSSRFSTLGARFWFFLFLIPQLFLVSIYPIFSVRSYFNSLRVYETIFGMGWFERQYPDDWAGINWLNQRVVSDQLSVKKITDNRIPITDNSPVIVEADGDSYTDYDRFSAFTGLPTIIGWPVHEWLWRGSYDVVAPRREEVRLIYESEDLEESKQILDKYHVRYVVVGTLEREKFSALAEWKFNELGTRAFSRGQTVIYAIH